MNILSSPTKQEIDFYFICLMYKLQIFLLSTNKVGHKNYWF